MPCDEGKVRALMRTILFVNDDENLLNKLRAIVLDKTVQCFFTSNVDKALEIIEAQEIALVVTDVDMEALSGREFLEMVSGRYPKTILMIMSDIEHVREAISIHNDLHTNKLIMKPWQSADEFVKWLMSGLDAYNMAEKQRQLAQELEAKSDKYKQVLFDMSNVLNDRMESYQKITEAFSNILSVIIQECNTDLTAGNIKCVTDYENGLMKHFVQTYFVGISEQTSFGTALQNRYHEVSDNRYFLYENEVEDEIAKESFQNIRFLMQAVTEYFSLLYPTYRAKVSLQEYKDTHYLINVLYELPGYEIMEQAGVFMKELLKQLMENYAARYVYGEKGHVQQYKIYVVKAGSS